MEHYMSGAPLLADGQRREATKLPTEEDEFFNDETPRRRDHQGPDRKPAWSAVAKRRRRHHVPRFKEAASIYMKGSCAGLPVMTATLQQRHPESAEAFRPDVVEVRPM